MTWSPTQLPQARGEDAVLSRRQLLSLAQELKVLRDRIVELEQRVTVLEGP